MEGNVPRGKIIQKRVQKKERYARMVRIRQRKQAQVALAGIKPIEDAPNMPIAHPKPPGQYELPMGFYVSEKDGKLDIDMSLLNKDYNTNGVEVYQDTDRMVRVNLNKKDVNKVSNTINLDFLEEWEKRDTPYWKYWVNRLKNFTVAYKDFIEKNKHKFKPGKHEKQLNAKYEEYVEKCREITKYKPTSEVVKSFNADSMSFSNINYSSKLIEGLHYDFNEFIDILLKKGLIRLRQTKVENGGMFGLMMDNFHAIFERPMHLPERELNFILKSGDLQKVTVNIMIAGHFVKNAAEVSFFLYLDVHKPIPKSVSILNPYVMQLAQNMSSDAQRRHFFERYYPIMYTQFISDWKRASQKRTSLDPMIEAEFETSIKTDCESQVSEIESSIKCEDEAYSISDRPEMCEE